jgi:hypothetical protein
VTRRATNRVFLRQWFTRTWLSTLPELIPGATSPQLATVISMHNWGRREMSVLPAARAAADGEGKSTQQSRAPSLITEQEVAFSTSAAASLPHTATQGRRDATRTVVATVRRMFVTATANSRPVRRDCPSHRIYIYIERARMSREMDRL